MKRSKIISILIVVATLGLLISSFIPTVAACRGNRKVTKRPIEDWLINNWFVGGHRDFETNIIIWPHRIHTGPDSFYSVPISDCSYDGYIIERSLKDNKLSITVCLKVDDAPFYVTLHPYPPFIPVFTGIMHYRWFFNFIIDLESYPEDHFDEYGNVLFDFLFTYLFNPDEMGVDLEYIFLYSCGEGVFLESWNSWEAGQTAKMNVMMFYLWKGEFLNHPKYNLYGLGGLVAIDYTSFW